jgi:hypothetical protein
MIAEIRAVPQPVRRNSRRRFKRPGTRRDEINRQGTASPDALSLLAKCMIAIRKSRLGFSTTPKDT